MMEWLQFSLLDMTPYDRQSWFNVVSGYHHAIWPMHLLALLLIVAVPLLMLKPDKLRLSSTGSVRLSLCLLGLCWLWVGAVFHWQYFANLNWAAPWFGWVFIVQGVLFIAAALWLKQGAWIALSSPRSILAMIALLAGLIVYPLSGLLEDRTLMQLEWFPLLPAPLTLVTVAVLMLLNTRWRHGLVVIPLLWAIVSAAFAATLGLLEFYFMAGVGVFWVLQPLVVKLGSFVRHK